MSGINYELIEVVLFFIFFIGGIQALVLSVMIGDKRCDSQ